MSNTQPGCVLYRLPGGVVLAGQPAPADWARLAASGTAAVLNIRSDAGRAAEQATIAEKAGLRYTYAPLPAYELQAQHMAAFAQIVEQPGNERLFIHCRTGTRVALLWSLHRMLHHGWSQQQAREELIAAGYDDDTLETIDFCTDDFFERQSVAAATPDA